MAVLHEWLALPHVSQWWGEPETRAQVEAHYLTMIAPESTTRGYIASSAGHSIGFLQSYVVKDSGDGWWEQETDPGARGIDQFLANAEQLGRGLGARWCERSSTSCSAIRRSAWSRRIPHPTTCEPFAATRALGSLHSREVTTPDGRALLMVRRR
jgi:hypothetical protein